MLAKLMLPKALVVTTLVFPVCVHIFEKASAAIGLENGSDVCVLAAFVAVLRISAITIVGPAFL